MVETVVIISLDGIVGARALVLIVLVRRIVKMQKTGVPIIQIGIVRTIVLLIILENHVGR